MAITTEHADYFNMDMTDDPYWSESSWFSWAIPERGVNGFFYNHFRPNMNCLLGGPAMWDRSGQHVWEFLYFDWQLMRRPPKGRYGVDYNKYDFETPWSMAIKMIKPLERYQLGMTAKASNSTSSSLRSLRRIKLASMSAARSAPTSFTSSSRGVSKARSSSMASAIQSIAIPSGTARMGRASWKPLRGAVMPGRRPMRRPVGTCSRETTRGATCKSSAAISCATERSRPS